MSHRGTLFGVAFKAAGTLSLCLRIHRNLHGEVFVVMASADRKANIHTSYHRDGRVHLKSHGDTPYMIRQEVPLKDFQGAVSLWGISLYPAINLPFRCDPKDFDDVFVMNRNDLTGTRIVHSSNLEIHLVERDGVPPVYPPSTILKARHIFFRCRPLDRRLTV